MLRLVPQQFPGAGQALPFTEIPLPFSGARVGAAAGPRAPGPLPGSCLYTNQGAGGRGPHRVQGETSPGNCR